MNNTTMTNNAAAIITGAQAAAAQAVNLVNVRRKRQRETGVSAYKTQKKQNATNDNAAGMYSAANEIKNEQTAAAVLYTALKELNRAEDAHELNKTKGRSEGNPSAYQSKTEEHAAANRIEGRRDVLVLICTKIKRSDEPQKLKDQAATILQSL